MTGKQENSGRLTALVHQEFPHRRIYYFVHRSGDSFGMTRFQWLIGVLVLVLVACAAPATPPSIPTQAPQRSHPPYPETLTAVAVSSVFNPASCATTNAAPPDKFRADEPAKLTAATGKPKLIEFFAYW